MGEKADIGLVGLAVMGQNLVLNMNDHGFGVAVFNRTYAKTEEFLGGAAKGRPNILGASSLEELVGKLAKPRVVVLLVKAGDATESTIAALVPLLEAGDIVIDGGNANFMDSERRSAELAAQGLLFVGSGVSGGEEGARKGPALMPGGNPAAWKRIEPIFSAIAAKASDGRPCCAWMGPGGAGHYVKMVHNGIEYGDMQLICEAYGLLGEVGFSCEEAAGIFSAWNRGLLSSYLIEITAEILAAKDSDGSPLVEKILDTAGQKGTGKWTVESSLELGMPLTLIGEAVYARCLSAMKDDRVAASALLGSDPAAKGHRMSPVEKKAFAASLEKALLAAKIVSYAQGFMLLKAAAAEHGWSLDYGSIAATWRGGCIIRSVFLDRIREAYGAPHPAANLLLAPWLGERVREGSADLRRVLSEAIARGYPVPALQAALSFYDGFRRARLPANLLQAQRDYFGAHQYERVDAPRGQFFHTDWTGEGGKVASGRYDV
jgi:6-phosphogluconate dehydrogenase